MGKSKKVAEKISKEIEQKTPWERVMISRHPKRPHGSDYIHAIVDDFIELHGDRLFRDDPAIIGGMGKIGDLSVMVVAQEKGHDTESRLKRNFGMPYPEGYRKALRLMKLAEKFHLPIVTFIDTPGAYPGLSAEERGQGWAIAENLMKMAALKTPSVSVVIGEGCSGGALGIGITDKIAMLEHSYYSVISPEGCASILWKDPKQNAVAAKSLKMLPENLKEFQIIDDILKEPENGAHENPQEVFQTVKAYLIETIKNLKTLEKKELLKRRYDKYRSIGLENFLN